MINEEVLLYMTAFLAIGAIVTILVMGIIVIRTMQKGVTKIYELFAILHKESETRIGNANMIVTQCSTSIEKAAVASSKCADAAEECSKASVCMMDMVKQIDSRYSNYIDKLREEKKQLEDKLANSQDVKVVPQYVTNNNAA